MSRDKQTEIEEMAKLVHLNYDMPYEFSKGLAEFLIDEGYRKASEVAREVFGIIEDKILELYKNEDKRYDPSVVKSKKRFDIATARYTAITEVVKLVMVDISTELEEKYESEDTE